MIQDQNIVCLMVCHVIWSRDGNWSCILGGSRTNITFCKSSPWDRAGTSEAANFAMGNLLYTGDYIPGLTIVL